MKDAPKDTSKKRIEIKDDSDEQIDIKDQSTETEQAEWSETLVDQESEAEEIVSDAEHEDTVADVTSDAASEDGDIDSSKTIEELDSEHPASSDKNIDEAVDEIVNEESTALLHAEDEARERQFAPPPQKAGFKAKLKSLAAKWWHNKRVRYGSLAVVVFLFIIALFIPFTRYSMLNIFGVRVSSNMVIVDSVTGLPLENIVVSLQGKESKSNEDGFVEFSQLKQGSSTLKIDKRGYATFEKEIVLGWGSNPIGEQSIVATGERYTFKLVDWLSDEKIIDGEARSGEDIAQANEEGVIVLTVGDELSDEVVLAAKGYREERIKIDELSDAERTVKMVPAKKHAFVSNRSGDYDLYTIDVDGQNENVLLEGTGKEREVPFVLSHPTEDYVAYVSSRDGDVNKDNFILDGLFVVDTKDGESYKVTRSEQLQIVGWSGRKLVFVSVVEGVSAGNSQRSKIISFDIDSRERTDIAASNYFNDVKLIDDTVYYAPSSYAVPQSQAKLFTVGVDGKNKKTLIDAQVWAIFRKDYSTLQFNAENLLWYEQQLESEGSPKKLDTQPVIRQSRIYSTSPDDTKAAWVDVRDGKGVLLVYDIEQKTESVIRTQAGLTDPVMWVDDSSFIYRVETSSETADYIMSISGDEPAKIADVVGNRSRYFY